MNKINNFNRKYIIKIDTQTEYGFLKKIDLSDNKLEDDGVIYLSISLKMCGFLETLV